MEIVLIISQAILVASILYFIYNHDKKEREKEKEIVSMYSQTMTDVINFLVDENKKVFEEFTKLQVEHFKQLEKTSAKQLQLVDKQTKEFFKHMKEEPKPIVNNPFSINPLVDKIDNQIEKEEIEEVALDETNRIPIVDGVKIKFEDEEEIFPMNITPSNV